MTTETFSYAKPKVIQALRYHFISRPEIRIMIILVNVFAITSAALYFFKQVSANAFLISSMLWFLLMIAVWFLLPISIYRKEHTFKDSFKAHVDKHEFAIENDRGSRSWPWDKFSSFKETPHFYHLYFNARSFFLLPKDAFVGDDVHEARKIFKARIK